MRDEGPRFEAVSFSDIEGWQEDDQAAALRALLRSCAVGDGPIASACAAARALDKEAGGGVSPAAARALFEAHFTPHAIAGGEPGLVTGYYEPELRGSRLPGVRFKVPVYGRPDDLVQLKPDLERARFNDELTCMRQTETGLVPYYTRAEIEAGALQGRGLELVYLDDPVELFFMQVQGSGLVLLGEGGAMRLSYAGKNGHPYSSIGARLVERGELARRCRVDAGGEGVAPRRSRARARAHGGERSPTCSSACSAPRRDATARSGRTACRSRPDAASPWTPPSMRWGRRSSWPRRASGPPTGGPSGG